MGKVDKRISDTKRIISEQAMVLLEHKSIDKITVKDITAVCQISRQTFYYHFQDVLDVFEYQLQRLFDELEQRCIQLDHPRDALQLVIQTGLDHRDLIVKIQKMKASQNMNQYAIRVVESTMRSILEKCQPERLDLKNSDLEVMLSFYAHGLCSYLTAKLLTGNYDPQQLTEQLYHILTGLYSPLKESVQ